MELLTLLDIDRQVERLRAELGVVEMLARHLAATVDSCAGPWPSAAVPAEVVASVSGKLQAWAAILEGQLDQVLNVHLVPTRVPVRAHVFSESSRQALGGRAQARPGLAIDQDPGT